MDFGKNITEVKFEDIEESGLYSQKLLDALRIKDFEKLKELPESDRMNRDFMEPLLYAVKNELDTYAVFKYYKGTIQQDEKLTIKVIEREPDIITDTELSADRQFVLKYAVISPRIIRYMKADLKEDYDFVQSLCQLHSSEVVKEIVSDPEIPIGPMVAEREKGANSSEQTNYKMSNDPTFISEGIRTKGVDFIINASDELKNNYEFMKRESAQNEDIVKYAAKHAKEFGDDGLRGICESSGEQTYNNAMDEINKKATEEAEKEDGDKRYKMVKDRLEKSQEEGKEEPYAMRFVAAMAAQSKDTTLEDLARYINYSTLMMEQIRRDVDEQGQLKTDFETMKNNVSPLIDPMVLKKVKANVEANGIEIDSDLSAQLDEYISFYREYFEKFQETKKQKQQVIEKETDSTTTTEQTEPNYISTARSAKLETLEEQGFGPKDVAEATRDLGIGEVKTAAQELAVDVKDPALENEIKENENPEDKIQ